MSLQTKEDGKTIAIISYITVIGLLIAYLMNNDKKNEFAKFHIGQSVRVVILAVANYILGNFMPFFITSIISLGILALVIIGIINASNLEEKPLPLIGTLGA